MITRSSTRRLAGVPAKIAKLEINGELSSNSLARETAVKDVDTEDSSKARTGKSTAVKDVDTEDSSKTRTGKSTAVKDVDTEDSSKTRTGKSTAVKDVDTEDSSKTRTGKSTAVKDVDTEDSSKTRTGKSTAVKDVDTEDSSKTRTGKSTAVKDVDTEDSSKTRTGKSTAVKDVDTEDSSKTRTGKYTAVKDVDTEDSSKTRTGKSTAVKDVNTEDSSKTRTGKSTAVKDVDTEDSSKTRTGKSTAVKDVNTEDSSKTRTGKSTAVKDVDTEDSSKTRTGKSVFKSQMKISTRGVARESLLFDPYIMINIFRRLNLQDQNNFRLVCTRWNEMAHKFWLKSSFNCRQELEKVKNNHKVLWSLIKEKPLLKTFICNLLNKELNIRALDIMLAFVEDLYHIEFTYATIKQVQSLVTKYKNLQSVTFYQTCPSLIDFFECLVQCEHVEKISILRGYSNSSYGKLLRIFADNFPKLKELLFMPVVSRDMVKELEYMLQIKSHLFTQLKLTLDEYSCDLGNSLGLCENLCKLQLVIYRAKTPFRLSGLKKLQDLYLEIQAADNDEVVEQIVTSIIGEGPQEHLINLHLSLHRASINLTLIPNNLKHLENVSLASTNAYTVSTLLSHLSDLRDLSSFEIRHLMLTEDNVVCIARCTTLKMLYISPCKITDRMISLLKGCTSLESLTVTNAKDVTLNAIKLFVKSAPNLKYLELDKIGLDSQQKREALEFTNAYKINAYL